eukprot:scaffold131148_cov40-Cyclotella_meneghiniana.AAC.4
MADRIRPFDRGDAKMDDRRKDVNNQPKATYGRSTEVSTSRRSESNGEKSSTAAWEIHDGYDDASSPTPQTKCPINSEHQ